MQFSVQGIKNYPILANIMGIRGQKSFLNAGLHIFPKATPTGPPSFGQMGAIFLRYAVMKTLQYLNVAGARTGTAGSGDLFATPCVASLWTKRLSETSAVVFGVLIVAASVKADSECTRKGRIQIAFEVICKTQLPTSKK